MRSLRHHYGALLAVQKPGGSFFPHECELLEVYARYAATALDTATALAEARARQQEAQRRYEESRTLLELARRLARPAAATRSRAASPTPCPASWTAIASASTCGTTTPRSSCAAPSTTRRPRRGRRRAARPCARRTSRSSPSWVDTPDAEPVFIDLETSAIQQPLRDLGAVAAVAVPINTETRFLGCFIVSVRARPERLA